MKKIKTIITYTIANDLQREKLEQFLEKACLATMEEDQSTYVSPLDKEEISLKLSTGDFVLNEEDFVNLYYCRDKHTAAQCLFLDKCQFLKKS